MDLGVCYYPEHWPQERWAQDAKLMRQAGLTLVRIAEFAWSLMEPRDGEFTWDWLDQAIDSLAAEDLKVILGTPTASPPPWLSKAHPEILPVDSQGRRRRYGSRRHYCANNPTYRQYTQRIVSAMASRYGDHPAVVGWQIDNEFGCHNTARCYCDTCSAAFRRWLKSKYGSIEALNQAWGTVFWSQIYNDWGEIEPPNLTVTEPNPSHALDYFRFSSDSYLSYQELQISALRPQISESQFITTNFMGQFTDLDYVEHARPLDRVTWDSYPTGQAEATPSLYMPQADRPAFAYDVGDPYITGFAHSLMRGFKPERPFWIMEQQCGNINWSAYNPGVRPGTVRLWTWHALASGAEAVLYFRWRESVFAQEQFHSGLLRHDASTAVGYSDLETIKAERELMAEIATAPHQAKIAILLDYDSIWSLQLQPHRRDLGYMRAAFVYHRAAQRLGLPANVVSTDADLSKYRIVVLPLGVLATERLADSLNTFVQDGGLALFGARCGAKTPDNRFTEHPLPGLFRSLVGITVGEWHSLPPKTTYDFSSSIPGLVGPAGVWAERLTPISLEVQSKDRDLHVLAQYTTGSFDAAAALTEHIVGKGSAFYLGWFPSDLQAQVLLSRLADQAGILPLADLPEGLVASQRGGHVVLLNFTDSALTAIVQGQEVMVAPRDIVVVAVKGIT